MTGDPYTPRNTIRDWNDGIEPMLGRLAQGDNMGSDDVYWIKFGPEGFAGSATRSRARTTTTPASAGAIRARATRTTGAASWTSST